MRRLVFLFIKIGIEPYRAGEGTLSAGSSITAKTAPAAPIDVKSSGTKNVSSVSSNTSLMARLIPNWRPHPDECDRGFKLLALRYITLKFERVRSIIQRLSHNQGRYLLKMDHVRLGKNGASSRYARNIGRPQGCFAELLDGKSET